MPEIQAYELPLARDLLRQGEIICGLVQEFVRIETIGTDDPEVSKKPHPFAVVMTQDCDLNTGMSDLERSDVTVPNILFCEAFLWEDTRRANALEGQSAKRVRDNQVSRFHLLEEVPAPADSDEAGLPPLMIDFRRYFTMTTAEVAKRLDVQARRRTRLVSPYVEDLVQRFHSHLSRVALPDTAVEGPVVPAETAT